MLFNVNYALKLKEPTPILFKFLIIMKIIFLLVFACIMQAQASGYAQNVTLSEKSTPIKSVLQKIESQTGYYFWYENTVIGNLKPVSVQFKNRPLKEALDLCFADQPITYEIISHTILLHSSAQPAYIDIRGIIRDTSGQVLAGATVTVKGTDRRSASDINGRFQIQANAGEVLLVSYIGYQPQEVFIATGQSNYEITLLRIPQEMEKIVVTALGIKKAERALTYNVQEIKSEEITRNKDANFVNTLSGKIAGVTINPSSSGIGGATRVVMRGTKSISGNNNVLYVVDGIPIPNSNGGANASGPFQGVVSGEGISSINPEDIETISALTGPAASALYGNQGSNGVIVVTTKKGSTGKLKINISHSTDFFEPFVLPGFQNTYGQGDPAQFQSWGAKSTTPSNYRPKDFFETGHNIFNAISFSGGNEKSQTFFSLASNNALGIIPSNSYNRYNGYLRQSTNFNDHLSVDFNVMYIKSDDKNMIAQGQYHNPLVGIYLFPPGDDIRKYQVYSRYDPGRKLPIQFWPYGNLGLSVENPYWITNEQSNTNNIDRYAISAIAKYKIYEWLNITGRVRMDNSSTLSEVRRAAGTDGLFASEFGYYTTFKSVSKNTYIDLMASINKNLTADIKFNSNIGGSYNNDKIDGLGAGGKLSRLANFYSVSENTTDPPTQNYSHQQLQSLFATAEFEYKRWLFLNLTGRYEWPSQLPQGFAAKTSYFYPSVGISGIFTDALHLPKNILSFGKVRLSYAEVGNPPGFGITNPVYSLINPDVYRPAPFPDYLPERTKSYEAGVELKFFRNKLFVNATVYKSNTTNQLLDQKLTTGGLYTDFYYNAGNIENKGIEASIGYNRLFGDITWNSSAVFTLNRNKVKRLSEGYTNPITGEVYGKDSIRNGTVGNDLINILAINGTMADLYITQILREDNQGYLWVDPSSGAIAKTNISPRYIGKTTPDYTIGWRNALAYKNLELSFLLDARIGGIGISYTQSIMDAYGVSQKSADERDNGGVPIYGKKYSNVQAFYDMVGNASGGSVGMAAYYVYSATNFRLREAAISYAIPGSLLKGRINDIKLAITGRNLFMFYNKSPFDPESTSSTGTYYQGIDYFRQPSYRSFGFNIRAQF
ncbi:MAG: SusC/RagA family TonB-linked outer membrane protein [Sphingobacteriales bacterium]|jgi:TonB-linked SusC/RagA family outer membrane protein|nr:SusC/RagA family TonB-linked outer membrane protein [Sphingobacteriales bacterium]